MVCAKDVMNANPVNIAPGAPRRELADLMDDRLRLVGFSLDEPMSEIAQRMLRQRVHRVAE